MTEDRSRLTKEQFYVELAKLGPCPPWWQPFKRRSWHATYFALSERSEDWEAGLQRIKHAIKHGDRED